MSVHLQGYSPVANPSEDFKKVKEEISLREGPHRLEITHSIASPNKKLKAYFSELEVFIAIFSEVIDDYIILKGCSFNSSGNPIFTYSPNSDYIALSRDGLIFIYCTTTWKCIKEWKHAPDVKKIIFSSPYSILYWTWSEYFIYSLYGTLDHHGNVEVSNCITGMEVSQCFRTAALSCWNDKVLIYDSLSWKIIVELVYPSKILSECHRIFKEEPCTTPEHEFTVTKLTQGPKSVLLRDLTYDDEFKVKTNRPFLLAYDASSRFLATYNPYYNLAWVWDLKSKQLLSSVVLLGSTTKIIGLQWHLNLQVLAILCPGRVIIWSHNDTPVGIHSINIMFQWYPEKLPMFTVSNKYKEALGTYVDQNKTETN